MWYKLCKYSAIKQIVFLWDSEITDVCFKVYWAIVAPDLRTNRAIFRTRCAATERIERTDCFRMLSERFWFPKLPATSIFNKNTYLTTKNVNLKNIFYGFIPGRVFRRRQILRELTHLPWPASSNMNKKLSLNGKLT